MTTAPPLPATGFRTTVRAAVVDGRAGLRAASSHDVVVVEDCLVAHPAIGALLAGGRFGAADEVVLRVAAATGERLVMATPTAAGVVLPGDLAEGTRVIGADELDRGRRAWIHDEVAGRRFRLSARSFFQTRTDGAAALVAEVRRAGGAELAAAGRVVDAYAGVGLFAATALPVAATAPGAGPHLTLIESNPSSAADARHNLHRLAGFEPARTRVVKRPVERWRPTPADVVIADPARRGLGAAAAAVLARTGANVVVLVSCDAAALARDARLLAGHGYSLDVSVVVDLFPHTHHVEVVSRFTR